ncbi:MAG TPA: Mur ligase family protein, partial [Clostridiales bacterium]|nr:Mur ligase family protein [Clostridiales bacterium]
MLLSRLLDGIPVTGKYLDVDVQEITDNSNNVTVGCLFVCIKGAHFDAHKVAYEVLQKGAAAVVVERDIGIEKQIVVDDSRAAFALLCKNFFERSSDKLKIIGVTGTNGKTTTTFVIKDILESLGKSCGLIGTVKNLIGEESVPSVLTTPDPFVMHALFKRMVNAGLEYCIIEVSSQAMHQKRLEGVEFEIGILTNISQDHLDYHGSIEEYIAAKKQLFYAC